MGNIEHHKINHTSQANSELSNGSHSNTSTQRAQTLLANTAHYPRIAWVFWFGVHSDPDHPNIQPFYISL